ncbi:alanine racemase [Tindallia californiensis]|uniref:Alanine racemase n=1 Tax=Tindallia californiensis TaxID=159292 RepID=A0A1H3K642_9FIRM|nr:alanine racemase [Tindallia californiensis]SDY47078.1 alanine racemase [Tindallia californiensis]
MKKDSLLRPVWAEINLDHLTHNMNEVRRNIPDSTQICAVIKANGYGHGAVQISRHLEDMGIERMAVATLTEAMELRNAGYKKNLMVLGYTPDDSVDDAIEKEIILTIYTFEQAIYLSKRSQVMNRTAVVHIKLDTGMSRLGFQPNEESVKAILEIGKLENVKIEGLYTHFAAADESNKKETLIQMERYHQFCQQLEAEGGHIPIKHIANSAATMDMPETHLDMVRVGIMMYGLYPSEEVDHQNIKLKRVMALKTKVAHVKEIEAGTGVSYGLTFRASQKMTVATLPIGYADGFTRMLGENATVTIRGSECPVIGRICMDQCMVDVTGIEVNRGDEVILYALEEEQGKTVDEVARSLGTINYEIVCMVGRRVPRVYILNDTIIEYHDDLLESCVDIF